MAGLFACSSSHLVRATGHFYEITELQANGSLLAKRPHELDPNATVSHLYSNSQFCFVHIGGNGTVYEEEVYMVCYPEEENTKDEVSLLTYSA